MFVWKPVTILNVNMYKIYIYIYSWITELQKISIEVLWHYRFEKQKGGKKNPEL